MGERKCFFFFLILKNIFYTVEGKLAVPIQSSNEADTLLQKIKATIIEGYL
jgi:hypothetical protein